jgi:hypothetical protein
MLEWKDENKQLKEKLKIKNINNQLEEVTLKPKISKHSNDIIKNIKSKLKDNIESSNISCLNSYRSNSSLLTNRD